MEPGILRGTALRDRLLSLPSAERDAWIDRVLGFGAPPPDDPGLPRGAVPYLPCGVDDLVAMVREAPIGPDDVVVDVGAGIGRVAIVAHLLSGARACGIEIQECLVRLARATAAKWSLDDRDDVSFVHGNAADEMPEGSIYFLYAPCNGAMLRSVMDQMYESVIDRPIVVCTVDLELHDVPWLKKRSSPTLSLSIYDSIAAK